MHQRKLWKRALTLLAAAGYILSVAATVSADIGTEKWHYNYEPTNSTYEQGNLTGAGFYSDGTVLVNGWRGENDSKSAVGIRLNPATGSPLDSPAEYYLFDSTWSDYTQDNFRGSYITAGDNVYFPGMGHQASGNSFSTRYNVPNLYKYAAGTAGSTPTWRKFHSTAGDTNDGGMFNAVAVDGSGNIYAAGYFGVNYQWDWIISKYDSDGNLAAGFPVFHGQAGLNDTAQDVAVDSVGNFVVVGSVEVSATTNHYDWVVRKYNSSGTLLWEHQYDQSGANEAAIGVVIDDDDNILVCGYRDSGAGDRDWYLVKYAKDGDGSGGAVVLWQQSWDSGNNQDGRAYKMALNANNNFYLIGIQNKEITSGTYKPRPVLQYRSGQTGALLKIQDVVLSPTRLDTPEEESDVDYDLTLSGDELVIVGSTVQGNWATKKGKTGRVVMLKVEKTYNVSTGNTDSDCSDGECNLQAALDAAANNVGINTVLRLQQGTYTGNFVYAPATGNNGDLAILGGYSADFSSRTLDPTNTILDGGNSGPVLQLNPGIAAGTTATNGSLMVEGVTVRNGHAGAPLPVGGGILALTNSPGAIELTTDIIENNLAEDAGGGCAIAVTDFATPTGGDIYFSDNIIRNNTVLQTGATDGNGGGCSFIVSGKTVLTNNLVYDNSVGDSSTYTTADGGGFDFDLRAGELILTNNTITDNQVSDTTTTGMGAGISLGTELTDAWDQVTVELYNTIIYNNVGDDIYNQVISETGGATDGSTLTIANSNYDTARYTQSPDAGTVTPTLLNNVNTDPALSRNPASLYRLISGSLCIDAGNNTAPAMPDVDLVGDTRPQDGDGDGTATANMGSLEGIVYSIDANPGTNGSLDGATPSPQIVYAGDTVTFTFNSDSTYHVASVSGCGLSYTNTDNTVTIYTATTDAVTVNCTVDATFSINTYTLTYTAGTNGSLTGTTPQTVDHGSVGTAVTAVPDTGYHFVSWSDGSTANPRTDTNVTGDISVTATFAINTYTLTYTAGTNGSLSGTTPQTVDHGSDGTAVTAVPDTGYHFVSWSDSSTANPRTDTNVTGDVTVTATFAINTYTLTYTAGTNGSISGTTPQTVDHGSDGTAVTAVPATGYHFVSWSDSSTANPRTDTNVTGDVTVTATFAINTYTLTYTAGTNGSISGTTPQTVDHGSDGTAVTAVPATGYHFVSWSDGSTDNPRTDTNVTADITVNATFATGGYTLTYTAASNGSIIGDASQTVDHAQDGTSVEAVPVPNYHFVDWSDGSTANPRTDTNVKRDISVTANFAIDTYSLGIVFAGRGGGTITSTPTGIDCTTDCSGDFDWNTGVILTAVADDKSEFMGWSGDLSGACAGTDPCTVTMDQAREITATFNGGFPWTMFLPALTGGNK